MKMFIFNMILKNIKTISQRFKAKYTVCKLYMQVCMTQSYPFGIHTCITWVMGHWIRPKNLNQIKIYAKSFFFLLQIFRFGIYSNVKNFRMRLVTREPLVKKVYVGVRVLHKTSIIDFSRGLVNFIVEIDGSV